MGGLAGCRPAPFVAALPRRVTGDTRNSGASAGRSVADGACPGSSPTGGMACRVHATSAAVTTCILAAQAFKFRRSAMIPVHQNHPLRVTIGRRPVGAHAAAVARHAARPAPARGPARHPQHRERPDLVVQDPFRRHLRRDRAHADGRRRRCRACPRSRSPRRVASCAGSRACSPKPKTPEPRGAPQSNRELLGQPGRPHVVVLFERLVNPRAGGQQLDVVVGRVRSTRPWSRSRPSFSSLMEGMPRRRSTTARKVTPESDRSSTSSTRPDEVALAAG